MKTLLELLEDACGTGKIWCSRLDRWMPTEEVSKLKNFVCFGDPRGDTFINEAPDADGVAALVRAQLSGKTGCEFLTKIFVVVRDGNVVPVSDLLSDVPNQGPIPTYPSSRLLGLELEYDSGSTELRLPSPLPPGWAQHRDGSLTSGHGTEMVLEPPLNYTALVPCATRFCAAFNAARTNTTKKGGFHVHVQVADYTHDHAVALAQLYHKFQQPIHKLVAESRRANTYCPAFGTLPTFQRLVSMFQFNVPAATRREAKGSRSYSVVNFAMMRVREAAHRTVEFRQGSTTKRLECLLGWAALCTAFVDMAILSTKGYLDVPELDGHHEPNFAKFVYWLKTFEVLTERAQVQALIGLSGPVTGVSEWAEWRRNYLHEAPTDELVSKAVATMGGLDRGVFFIARQLDVNVAVAKRVMDKALADKRVTLVVGGTPRWKKSYNVDDDLARLEQARQLLVAVSGTL